MPIEVNKWGSIALVIARIMSSKIIQFVKYFHEFLRIEIINFQEVGTTEVTCSWLRFCTMFGKNLG